MLLPGVVCTRIFGVKWPIYITAPVFLCHTGIAMASEKSISRARSFIWQVSARWPSSRPVKIKGGVRGTSFYILDKKTSTAGVFLGLCIHSLSSSLSQLDLSRVEKIMTMIIIATDLSSLSQQLFFWQYCGALYNIRRLPGSVLFSVRGSNANKSKGWNTAAAIVA